MTSNAGQIYSRGYFEYLYNRSKFRKLVRRIYLNDITALCFGKTIDFGCGVGELLKMLPSGSIGFEVNTVLVNFVKEKGLSIELYDPELDDYRLSMIEEKKYSTFTMNHVLEHLENSFEVIQKIFESCNRLGVSRIVFTVPGWKGYQSDKTHITFIDLDYLKENGILKNEYFVLKMHKYFPFNSRFFGKHLTHNELRLVFEKR